MNRPEGKNNKQLTGDTPVIMILHILIFHVVVVVCFYVSFFISGDNEFKCTINVAGLL